MYEYIFISIYLYIYIYIYVCVYMHICAYTSIIYIFLYMRNRGAPKNVAMDVVG